MAFAHSIRRSFSTSNLVASKLVKAPVQLFSMEGRYATALYSAATKQQKLEKVEEDLKKIHKLFIEDSKFHRFVLDPTLQKKLKKDTIMAITKKLNLSDVSTNFYGVVAENGRLNKLENMFKAFATLMSAHRGELLCEITTAKPVDDAMMKEIHAALQGFAKKGQTLTINTKIDPSIIGGLIISVGDKYCDMSIATKVRTYERLIREAV